MDRKLPNRITFQWHLTDQCNFRCKHCYQEDYTSRGLQEKELAQVLENFVYFVNECKKVHHQVWAHINFTGGEPFLKPELIQLIEKTKETGLFSFGILSNGYLPSGDTLYKLKLLQPRFVQISLEGTRKTNDEIRGKGSYDKILNSLKTYKKLGVPTMVSFTANSKNYLEYPHVIKVARKYRAFKVWTDRYLPCNGNDGLQLGTVQFKKLGELINKEKKWNKYFWYSKTEISTERALQFLLSGGQPYRCSAGDTLFAILANGDLLPCRRLSIKIGNVLVDNLVDVYMNSPLLRDIHGPDKLDPKCAGCYYKRSCAGGLKCLSYATIQDYNKKDVNCWI